MTMHRTKGKQMFAAELPPELVAAFKAYAQKRGERIAAALERALRREMAYPPPEPQLPPLPDGEPDRAPARKPAKRK